LSEQQLLQMQLAKLDAIERFVDLAEIAFRCRDRAMLVETLQAELSTESAVASAIADLRLTDVTELRRASIQEEISELQKAL
jgi:DNA gyrase/topoisomerase IV subunit A